MYWSFGSLRDSERLFGGGFGHGRPGDPGRPGGPAARAARPGRQDPVPWRVEAAEFEGTTG